MKSPIVSRKKYEEEIKLMEIKYKNSLEMIKEEHNKEKEKILKDLPDILCKFIKISMTNDHYSNKYRLCTDIDIDKMSQVLLWGNDDYWIQYIAENVKRQIIQTLKSKNCFREVDETDRRGYGYFDYSKPPENYLKD